MVKDNFDNIEYVMKIKSKGNDSFAHKKYKKAINEYTEMLELLSIEKKNYDILAITLSNRGTSHFNLKHYVSSFLDLYFAVLLNPDNEKYQNKLLKVISQLESLPNNCRKYIDELLTKDFMIEANKNQLNNIKEKLISEKNNVSDDLSIIDIKNKGKGIVVTKDIKQNTVIIKESPILYLQTNHFQEYCSYCGIFSYNRFYCCNCFYGYCSLECFNKGKDNHLCYSYVIKNDMFLTICHFALTLYYYNKSIFIYLFIIEENEYSERINELYCELPKESDKIEKAKSNIDKYLKTIDHSILKGKEIPSIDEFLIYYYKIAYNHQKINIYSMFNSESMVQMNTVELGIGLYKITSYINHDCDSNCMLSYNNNTVNVIVLNDIPKETEITISYGPTIQNVVSSMRRKHLLYNEYNFECSCRTCIKPSEEKLTELKYLCDNCHIPLFCDPLEFNQAYCCQCNKQFPTEKLHNKLKEYNQDITNLLSILSNSIYILLLYVNRI